MLKGWVAPLCACVLVIGCGGGGSSGPTRNSSITLSTNNVTQTATTADAAPTASLQITLTNPPSGTIYVGESNTSNGVSSVQIAGVSQTTATVTISFKSPAQLGAGVYNDTITIEVCYDAQCSAQVGNSPATVTVQYTVTGAPQPGAPTLTSLTPSSAVAGGAAFTLTAMGTGFVSQSVLQWNGSARTTTAASATQLTAQITAADIAAAGTAAVTVSNAATGGGTSAALNFTIQPATLALNVVSPMSVPAGGPAFVLTAVGAGFVSGATVQWNGGARATTFVSSTELTAQITAADIASVGTGAVTVSNPAPQSGVTSAINVNIVAPSKDAVAFQMNPAHTGVVSFNSVSLPSASTWTATLPGPPSYALIAAGKVFVTANVSGNAELVALNQADGTIAWGPIGNLSGFANAAYDNGQVFVLSATTGSAALLQAFDAATGTKKWSVTLTGQYLFQSPPTAANGFVYAEGAGSGATVYAVDQNTGALVWTGPVFSGNGSSPVVTADGVYVTYPCLGLDFRPLTGELVWQYNGGCSGGGGATSVVADGILFAAVGFGSYNATELNAETGAVVGSSVESTIPAIGSQTGYFLQSGTLRGITVSSNTVLWSFAGDGSLVTAPIVVNQYVFVGSSTGNVYALDATTGAQLWVKNVGAAIPASPGWDGAMPFSGLAAGDGLLVVPAGSTLTAYTLSTSP
jgi:outer membrane protein assembly factor BamB